MPVKKISGGVLQLHGRHPPGTSQRLQPRLAAIEQRNNSGQQPGGIDREATLDDPFTDRNRPETALAGSLPRKE